MTGAGAAPKETSPAGRNGAGADAEGITAAGGWAGKETVAEETEEETEGTDEGAGVAVVDTVAGRV